MHICVHGLSMKSVKDFFLFVASLCIVQMMCCRLTNPVHASVFACGMFHTTLTFWVILLPSILTAAAAADYIDVTEQKMTCYVSHYEHRYISYCFTAVQDRQIGHFSLMLKFKRYTTT